VRKNTYAEDEQMKLEKDLYTINEVCAIFGVTRATVYDWMDNRGLVWIRLGARRRITKEALEAFMRVRGDAVAPEEYNRADIRTPMPAQRFEPAR
jgi:excisionase family DNA binding protein